MTDRSGVARPISPYFAALFVVLVLGGALRIWGVLQFPFEQDELYTEIEARLLFQSPLTPGIDARPFYYLLTHHIQSWLPPTAPALRAPALLFGMLGLWATWLLAREFSGRWAGLAALVFAAVVPWHLHASSMARYWSLIYLTAALGYYLLLRAYRTDRRASYAAACVALLVGSLTHPTFIFPMLGAVLGLTVVKSPGVGWAWPTRRAWLWLWGPYVAGTLIFALLLVTTDRAGSVRNFSSGRGWSAVLRLVPAMVDLATPVLFVAGLAGALLLIRAADLRLRRAGYMTVFGLLSGGALLLLSAPVTRTYADYGVAMLPLVVAAAASFVTQMAKDGSEPALKAGKAWLMAGVVLTAMAPATVSFLADGNRFDYRPALDQIRSEQPSRPVLIWPIILQRAYAPTLDGIELRPRAAYLDSVLTARGALWAVVSVQRYGIVRDDHGEISRWLDERCRRRGEYGKDRYDYRSYRVELYFCHTDASSQQS